MTKSRSIGMDGRWAVALGRQMVYICLDMGAALLDVPASAIAHPPPLISDGDPVIGLAIFEVITSNGAIALEGGLGNGPV